MPGRLGRIPYATPSILVTSELELTDDATYQPGRVLPRKGPLDSIIISANQMYSECLQGGFRRLFPLHRPSDSSSRGDRHRESPRSGKVTQPRYGTCVVVYFDTALYPYNGGISLESACLLARSSQDQGAHWQRNTYLGLSFPSVPGRTSKHHYR